MSKVDSRENSHKKENGRQRTSGLKNYRFWSTLNSLVKTNLEHLQNRIGTRYKTQFEEIDQESKLRMSKNELALFSHPLLQFSVFLGALVVFLSLLSFTAPPQPLVDTLVGENIIYIKEVELCFSQGCLSDPSKIHKVTLPHYVEPSNFSDFQDHDLFYRIRPNLTRGDLASGLDTLLIPILWGNASVYRSGVLLASGPNFWPLIPILDSSDEIVIHISSPSGQKFGIRGTFAPFVSKNELARKLEVGLQGELFKLRYAFVAQLAGMCLLLIMFITFPYRPELFAFLVLFGIETLRSWLVILFENGSELLSPKGDQILYGFLCAMGAFAVIFFVGLFFRRSFLAMIKDIGDRLGIVSFSLIIGYFGLTSLFPIRGQNALFIVVWLDALWLSWLISKNSLLYLFHRKLSLRFLLGTSSLCAIGYWSLNNVYDHFVTLFNLHRITSPYQNHLHFFFVMAMILGIEIGRTEIKIKEAFSFLPKEVVRLIHDHKEEWREGFVILVDVVGWTSKLNRLDGSETPIYMRKINEHLLSTFDEPNASVISGTGDGYYFTFEEAPSAARFQKLTQACVRLAQDRPTFDDLGVNHESVRNEKLIVRSAIGYGRYYTGFAKTKYLKRDFIAGFLITLLARVIGNDTNPTGPRVLAGLELDSFKSTKPTFIQETKGASTEYWIVD